MSSPGPRRMPATLATIAAMAGFAANSLLTRVALGRHLIDPATFTLVRLASGAFTMFVLVRSTGRSRATTGSPWPSAAALFAYAAAFSYAYVRIGASVGALILFGSVQVTMIGWGFRRGERPGRAEALGVLLAVGGLLILTAPGAGAPDLGGTLLMTAAGIAWGIYSLRGSSATDPLAITARNFAASVVPALALAMGAIANSDAAASRHGIALAVASGSLASGLAYALWYRALPSLTALQAAVAQLSVPVLAACGAILWLNESPTPRLLAAGAAILMGIVLVMTAHRQAV